VLTVSDTRTVETDESGALIRALLEADGHLVIDHKIVPDEPEMVGEFVVSGCARPGVDALLITGGTGLTSRDSTYEAISCLLEKRLDGFGELFRMLSFKEIGAAAMLSRASAGVCNGTMVFSMPGSTAAVRLATEKLILPELRHIAALLAE
jgi:molybdenum cofactor biosynthesis protein B